MKKISIAFTGIACLVFTLGFETLCDWYLFDSKGFSIEFPIKPAATQQNVSTAIGELKMDIWMYEAAEDGESNFLYGLITSEYPDSLVNSEKVAILPIFFKNAIDGMVKNVEGKLLSEKSIELNGFPGKEVKVDFRNGVAVIRMRLYMVHNKLFVLQTITKTAQDNNADAIRFHNSFKIKK